MPLFLISIFSFVVYNTFIIYINCIIFIYNSKFKPINVTALWYNSIGIGEDDDGGDDML